MAARKGRNFQFVVKAVVSAKSCDNRQISRKNQRIVVWQQRHQSPVVLGLISVGAAISEHRSEQAGNVFISSFHILFAASCDALSARVLHRRLAKNYGFITEPYQVERKLAAVNLPKSSGPDDIPRLDMAPVRTMVGRSLCSPSHRGHDRDGPGQ
jgi:hypothetical protein